MYCCTHLKYWTIIPLEFLGQWLGEQRIRKTQIEASLDWLTIIANFQVFSHLRKLGETTIIHVLTSFDAILVSFPEI